MPFKAIFIFFNSKSQDFENKYVNVLEMDTHIFICYENERIEFMKIELSKIWIMYTGV